MNVSSGKTRGRIHFLLEFQATFRPRPRPDGSSLGSSKLNDVSDSLSSLFHFQLIISEFSSNSRDIQSNDLTASLPQEEKLEGWLADRPSRITQYRLPWRVRNFKVITHVRVRTKNTSQTTGHSGAPPNLQAQT